MDLRSGDAEPAFCAVSVSVRPRRFALRCRSAHVASARAAAAPKPSVPTTAISNSSVPRFGLCSLGLSCSRSSSVSTVIARCHPIPIALRADWIFRTTQVRTARRYHRAVRISLFAIGVTPSYAGALRRLFRRRPWQLVLRHLVVMLSSACSSSPFLHLPQDSLCLLLPSLQGESALRLLSSALRLDTLAQEDRNL